MSVGEGLERANLLFSTGRYRLAEEAIRPVLAEDPHSTDALCLLARCLSRLRRRDEALEAARAAVASAPDFDWAHYVLADVRHDRRELGEAEESLLEAIRIDPEYAAYRELLANIRLDREDHEGALEAAREGIALDPERAHLRALEGLALFGLRRVEEAEEAFEEALRLNPEDPLAHAGLGRVAVRVGDRERATGRFREALRIQPGYEWARRGLLDVLRARYPVYGILLRFFEWVSGLSGRTRAFLFAGGFVFAQAMRKGAAAASGGWRVVLYALFFGYLGFILLTWIADPLFNLALRLRRDGRLLLDEDEIRASTFVGLLVAGAAALGVAALATGREGGGLGALALVTALPSVVGLFHLRKGGLRVAAGTLVVTVLVFALIGCVLAMTMTGTAATGGKILMLGSIVFFVIGAWVAFGLGIAERG